MKPKYKCCLGILIILGLFFFLFLGISVPNRNPYSTSFIKIFRCLNYMDILSGGLALYDIDNNKLPWTKPNSEKQNIKKIMVLLTDTNQSTFKYFDKETRKNYIFDLWDNEYNVYFDTNNNSIIKIGNLTISNSFAIWSNGENKSNEFGKGDDVVNWENDCENIERIKKYKRKKWLKFFGFE